MSRSESVEAVKETVRQAAKAASQTAEPVKRAFERVVEECEICLTKRSVIVWICIIALISVILWYMIGMFIVWLRDLFANRRSRRDYAPRPREDYRGDRESVRGGEREYQNWEENNGPRRRPGPRPDDDYGYY